jgi:hypothetical protein
MTGSEVRSRYRARRVEPPPPAMWLRQDSRCRKRPTTASDVVFRLLALLLCVSLCPSPLAPREALAQELLQNGGFEDGAPPWNGCGGVSVVDRQDAGTTAAMVRTGRYAARIGGLSDGGCGGGLASQFVIVQPVAIPADATDLTLSFWFSRLGPDLAPDGNSFADLGVSLSTDPSFGMALFDVVSHNVLRGWIAVSRPSAVRRSRSVAWDDDVSPHDDSVPATLKARITRLSVVRPDGSGRREVFATQGLEGTSGSPPFCRPPQCVDTPRAALDQIIKGVEWSPDGRTHEGRITLRPYQASALSALAAPDTPGRRAAHRARRPYRGEAGW